MRVSRHLSASVRTISGSPQPVEASIASKIHLIEPLGDVTVVSVEAGGETLRIVLPEASATSLKPGDAMPITFDHNKIHIFRAASGQVMT